MSEPDPYHRLELWFMRDLSRMERASLFRLYGISHLDTRMEQQRAFRKILDDCRSPAVTNGESK
jgi:hypothetical protein